MRWQSLRQGMTWGCSDSLAFHRVQHQSNILLLLERPRQTCCLLQRTLSGPLLFKLALLLREKRLNIHCHLYLTLMMSVCSMDFHRSAHWLEELIGSWTSYSRGNYDPSPHEAPSNLCQWSQRCWGGLCCDRLHCEKDFSPERVEVQRWRSVSRFSVSFWKCWPRTTQATSTTPSSGKILLQLTRKVGKLSQAESSRKLSSVTSGLLKNSRRRWMRRRLRSRAVVGVGSYVFLLIAAAWEGWSPKQGYDPLSKKLEIVTTANQDPLLCKSSYFLTAGT